MASLRYVRPGGGFVPSFPMLEKVEVNGQNQHPLYAYLKSDCPPADPAFSDPSYLFYKPMHVNDVRWNFEKFLINKRGRPVSRYPGRYLPADITRDIRDLLMESAYRRYRQ